MLVFGHINGISLPPPPKMMHMVAYDYGAHGCIHMLSLVCSEWKECVGKASFALVPYGNAIFVSYVVLILERLFRWMRSSRGVDVV